ncbi:MAG: hypothetical protein WA843_03025, partial [Candidatus Saccharimonadales bacterium]
MSFLLILNEVLFGGGWAKRHVPADLFRDLGLIGTEDSEGWLNVVEHNVFVAAAALTIGQKLIEDGVVVDLNKLVRATIIHDATKRLDVERGISRDDEVADRTLKDAARQYGYTIEDIAIAKNTGRLADRFIRDPSERLRTITNRSIEENIAGYADARTRGVHLYNLDEAMQKSITTKPASKKFLTENWRPYYGAVEYYLHTVAPNFNPSEITDSSI